MLLTEGHIALSRLMTRGQTSDKCGIQCEEQTDTFVADSPLYIIHEKNSSVPSVQSLKP
jgi:hypothetical protein